MELAVVEESPKRIVFDLKGQSHTLCNLLKHKLLENKHIKTATYAVTHPMVGIPRVIVETDGDVKPRKAVADGAEAVRKEMAELRQEMKKIRS